MEEEREKESEPRDLSARVSLFEDFFLYFPFALPLRPDLSGSWVAPRLLPTRAS